MKQRSTQANRGLATATALTLLAFVAVLLTAMGSWIRIDARRTRDAAAQTQLRQLLLAGAVAAGDESNLIGATNVTLPPQLKDDAANLKIEIVMPSEGERVATIEASVSGSHASQTVHFTRREGRWRVISATLGPK